MYTVIIQSRTAKESYDEFYPLLANTVYEKSDVKVCEWIEDATTLGTAVPELMNAVERKKQWRAIVVQLDLGDENPGCQTVDGNPFDFLQYHEQENKQQLHFQNRILRGDVAWSDIPLVRITQMLKGIPEPVPEFEDDDPEQPKRSGKKTAEGEKLAEGEEEGESFGKKPMEFIFDQPELIEEKKHKVSEWNEACLTQFAPPAEILLVRARRRINGVQSYEMDNKWGAHWETMNSSRFRWENGYAEGCRFLVFDVDAHGDLRRRSDMFRLWLCVQLLSENRINSNTLQADRLYRMDVTLEEKKLSDNLQNTANQLNFAQYESAKHLKEAQQTVEKEEEEEQEKADNIEIDKTIRVNLDDVDNAGFQLFEDSFPLTPENGVQDRNTWRSYTEHARQQWIKLLRSVSRRLAAAARTLHVVSKPADEEVVPLDEYREEDLRDLLDEYYTRILEEQENLPANEFDLREDLENREKEVRRAIRSRLRTRSAVRAWGLPSLLIVASMCYGFIAGGSPVWLGIAIGASVLLVALTVRIVLKVRFARFMKTLRGYEGVYLRALLELENGSATYSSFFSKIASRIYGENYLAVLELQRAREDEKNENLQRKIRKVEWFQDTLERWCEALQLDIDMDNREALRAMAENKYHPREENLYQLATGLPRSVEIGHTGTYVRTAYDFIEGMTIEREEVFGRE